MDIAGIVVNEVDGKIFLRGQAVDGRPLVDAAALYSLLLQGNYGQCALDDDAIAAAAVECNTKTDPFVIQLGERCDAKIHLEIAPDEMSAQMSVTPSRGGKPASVERAAQALLEAGVVFGIDRAAVLQVCTAGATTPVVVATGEPAQDGVDAVFVELIPEASERAPKVDELGFIDYREHGAISVVSVGAPLMRRTPATAGIEGHTIRGTTIPARPGRDEPFASNLTGTELAKDDPDLLQAAIAGQPVKVTHGVTVEPILRVAEVNMATGNLHFDGTVQVDGEVTHGMTIEVSGDIVVTGTVDGAVLQAGGNIRVGGGVISHAKLHAGGSVSARFAEASQIYAGTTIALDDMALECDLQALNQITVGVKAKNRGRLVGGSAKAMMLITVPNLGSDKSGITHAMVGFNPELEKRAEELTARLATEKANEEKLQKLVTHLRASGDPKHMLEKVVSSWREAVQVWGKSMVKRFELDKEMALIGNAKIKVSVGLEGSVELAFGSHKVAVHHDYGPGSFSVNEEGHPIFTNSGGMIKPVT